MLDIEALQGALRMLFLLDRCGHTPVAGSHAESAGAVAVITAEKKLQALHFWMRNGDYLAYEILSSVEAGEFDSTWLDTAEALLDGEEPELRHYPMLRHRFGAFEPIDDSFSYLAAAGLAECHRSGEPGQVQRTDLYLLSTGRETARRILGRTGYAVVRRPGRPSSRSGGELVRTRSQGASIRAIPVRTDSVRRPDPTG